MPRKPTPERSLVRLLHSTDGPAWLVDSQRRLVYLNPACAQRIGQSPENLLGSVCNFHPALTPAEAAAALGPPPEAFTGAACRSETHLGEELFEIQFSPLRNDSGAVQAVLAVACPPPDSRLETESPRRKLLRQQQQRRLTETAPALMGDSPLAERLRQQVQLAGASGVRTLIVGRRGSGLEETARTIHSQMSPDKRGPLITIDGPLTDAELLQGVITSALRQLHDAKAKVRATLLVTQADRLPPDAQVELNGFLSLPGVELATIATATLPLIRASKRGKYLPELAYALSALTIRLPPLRRRPADIPLLAQHCLQRYNARGGRQFSGFASEALDELVGYRWPGEMEELAAVVDQSCAACPGTRITVADLPPLLRHDAQAVAHARPEESPLKLDDFLAEVERELLSRALRKSKGNKSQAAELLGVSRPRLLRRLAQLGLIQPEKFGEEDAVVFEPLPEEK